MALRDTTGGVNRIVLVEEDSDSGRYLRTVFQSATDLELVGEFSTIDELVLVASRLCSRMALLSLHELSRQSLDCIKKLKHIIVGLKIIIVAGAGSADVLNASVEAGAEACLIRPVSAAQCLATLRFAARKSAEIESETREQQVQFFDCPNHERRLSLTVREQAVMKCLAEGLLYKEIADRLELSYGMVHKYQHRLFKRLQVANRSEAIRAWSRLALPLGKRVNGEY